MGNHSDHNHNETPKRIHFGAPIIMGLSFWLITFGFLSMCDGPKECCEGEMECCKDKTECKHEMDNKEAGKEEANEKTVVVDSAMISNAADSAKVETPVKEEEKK
jgi:hypothetical protein